MPEISHLHYSTMTSFCQAKNSEKRGKTHQGMSMIELTVVTGQRQSCYFCALNHFAVFPAVVTRLNYRL